MTERIKEALEKARKKRQQGENGTVNSPDIDTDSGSRLGNDRILNREPFRRYSASDQQKILDASRILNIEVGETFQFAGDRDAYVHYLLSGAVVLESDEQSTTVSADEDSAQLPLDEAGEKSRSITAASEVEVLRVPREALPAAPMLDDSSAIPTADYTETMSGRELADLVEQINSEQAALETSGPSIVDPMALLEGSNPIEDTADPETTILDRLEFTQDGGHLDESGLGYEPKLDDEIGQFARELEERFARYVTTVREQERARYEEKLRRHAAKLQDLARQQINKKLGAMRERYNTAYAEREQKVRERYRSLRIFANKMARQKAAIYTARRQISEKLQSVERIQAELAMLGSQLNSQLDEIDELMPDKTGTES